MASEGATPAELSDVLRGAVVECVRRGEVEAGVQVAHVERVLERRGAFSGERHGMARYREFCRRGD